MSKKGKNKRKMSKISVILISFIWISALIVAFMLLLNSIKNTRKFKRINSDIKIPEGFYYVGGDIDTGVVISDNKDDEFKGTEFEKVSKLKGNQFVWVPVEKAIAEDFNDAKKLINEEKNPIAIRDGNNYKAINYVFDLSTKSKNIIEETKYTKQYEPSIINAYIYGDSEEYIEGSTKELYQDSFNKMIESVEKNKGFYVSRYEVGNLKNAVNNNEKIVSKAGEEDITYMDWIHLYKVSKNMYDRDDINVEMIWGCQWYAMLCWIDQNQDVKNNIYDAKNIGNYYGSLKKSGSQEDNVMNNIYDLAGNAFEWSQKSNENGGRAAFGGSYLYDNNYSYSLGFEKGYPITYLWNEVGTRVTMYLN